MRCRRARTFDAAAGTWKRTPPPRAFYDCTWLVQDHVRPRNETNGKLFCARQSMHEAKDQIRDELGGRLLAGKKKGFAVDLWSVMDWSGFLCECGWEDAGMPGDEGMQDWLVRYLGTCIEEVQQQRGHRAGNSASTGLGPVAAKLAGDVDWLHDAATRFYVHKHHPGAAAEFGWVPVAAR